MGILKFNDISIETPYELISILDIKLNHEISIHSTLEIHAICKEESFDPFYKTTLKDFVELKKDDKTAFKGLIGYYNTKREGDLYSIIIKAVSATSLLDSQIKSQSFQDINMTYSNVISESIKDINGASFLFNLKDKTIDEPIIRYNETAWEFVNRLVSHFSSVLVCDIIENKPRFYFGFNKKNTINIDDSLFYESSKDLLSLNLSVDKLMDTDVFYHEIKSREVYELQDTVNFKNKTLFISSIKGEFIKSELIFTYKLSRLKGIRQNKIYNENIKGASLEGKVLDTKEELVKLHLNIDDKQDKATAYWFKVAQLTNNVFYIMYEKDTFSRLYFPSNKEVEAEVKNSVRKNGSTCPLTKKPENRYLTTKDKNQMSLKPSSVEFKSNEGLKLSTLVEDSFGAKLVSHKNINLNSKGSISFHAKNMVNITAKTDVLFYRDNKLNPQSFTMENEFHYLGNNVLLEGADRSSYSSIGDDPLLVTPIKKSFDWGKLALGVLAGLAAVAAVTAVVATGGAALVAAGAITSATSAVTGAAVAGGIA
ncbi:MAG: hypothetical protein N4A54_06565, partial [Peptostreptococcaceae bacterium]|nr:hypothetical protein [Peptostreptococcaceae bacterium]